MSFYLEIVVSFNDGNHAWERSTPYEYREESDKDNIVDIFVDLEKYIEIHGYPEDEYCLDSYCKDILTSTKYKWDKEYIEFVFENYLSFPFVENETKNKFVEVKMFEPDTGKYKVLFSIYE